MRFIGKLLIGLIALVGILAVVAFALPREIEVSRSVVVNAPAEKIFPHINDLRKNGAWSPWAKIDPKTTYAYTGPEQGVGQQVTWSSTHRDVGSGTQKIVESVANRRVAMDLDFGDMGTAKADFQLKAEGNGTRVTWNFETDAGNNPMMRWMGLMMDTWIGNKYEEGLGNLKTIAEQA